MTGGQDCRYKNAIFPNRGPVEQKKRNKFSQLCCQREGSDTNSPLSATLPYFSF
jgi:hypothetical protein